MKKGKRLKTYRSPFIARCNYSLLPATAGGTNHEYHIL